MTPEEVYTGLRVSGGSSAAPCDWLRTELPHRLDEICAMAASFQHEPKPLVSADGAEGGVRAPGTVVPVSRAEAKQAWLAAEGDSEKAARQALRNRQTRVRVLKGPGHLVVWPLDGAGGPCGGCTGPAGRGVDTH